MHLNVASFSNASSVSHTCLMSSAEATSKSLSFAVASVKVLTLCSAWTTPWSTSAIKEAILRSDRSFLNLANLLALSSVRLRYASSSGKATFVASLPKRRTSASLFLTKACVCERPVPAFRAAASHSRTAFAYSSCGNTSIPSRKGVSASWHLANASSIKSIRSAATFTACCADIPSRLFRNVAKIVSSFARNPMACSLSFKSFSLVGPSAVFIFCSTVFMADPTPNKAGFTTCSTPAISSADSCCPSAPRDVSAVALSASASAPLSFSATSMRVLCASKRMWKSFLNVLYGLRAFCASVSFICKAAYSATANFAASGLSFLLACEL
mmetsp:Transcript_1843/g.4291  ORF Transcript_1843/g.4291 Transcript_1843/m.4291 type:complete len:327 (-) Transcript_1843:775-1755(-)